MEVRILTETDAEAFWNIRLGALRDDPHSFTQLLKSSSNEVSLVLRIGPAQTAYKSCDDVTFGGFRTQYCWHRRLQARARDKKTT